MIYIFLLSAFLTIAIIISLFGAKSRILSPMPLHMLPWLLVMILGGASYDYFNEFTEKTFHGLLIWLSVLFFFYFFSDYYNSGCNGISVRINEVEYKSGRYWLVVIPLSIYIVYEIYTVGVGGPSHFFLNLRLANTMDDYTGPKFRVMTAVYPMIMAMFAIVCVTKTSALTKYSIVFCVILFCIGTMGKFAVITPVLVFLVIYDFKKKLNIKKLLLFSFFIVGVALALHFVRMANNDEATISSVLGLYLYSPIIAFGQLNQVVSNHTGEFTFRFIYALFNKLNFINEQPVNTILDYVYVPIPTNVYTVMQPFYQDYGYIGIFFGALFYGAVFSGLYTFAIRGSILSLLTYALLSISSVTAFLGETLITNFSGNIKLVLCLIILWCSTVKCKRRQ